MSAISAATTIFPEATSAELNDIKRTLQDHLTPGIVLIVGSGLSCAESLPSMSELVSYLENVHPSKTSHFADWPKLLVEIKSKGLEAALKDIYIPEAVGEFLRHQIASCVQEAEDKVVHEVLSGSHILRFTQLLKHLPQDNRFTVITTNYDRLIELSAEACDFLVDTRSRGNHLAPFSKDGGSYAFARNVISLKNGKGLRKIEQRLFSLYKPHGSLDWVDFNGNACRTSFNVGPERSLIITPGRDKYRAGYNQPFDMHRELANHAIDKASHLLIIGYGFNDDHLETHLAARIRAGVPTVILTYGLTSTARAFIGSSNSVWGLESSGGTKGTIVHNGANSRLISNENLWDVEGFVKGVFK